MMKFTLVNTGETRNYVKYESPNFETVFKSNLFAMKLWIPKSELYVTDMSKPFPVDGPGHVDIKGNLVSEESIIYPPFIEVGILDDSDGSKDIPVETRDKTLKEIIEEACQ